jgi:DNA-binding NarL/FixJ family response regulator
VTEAGQAVPDPIEVVLADDHTMVRAGLRMVLEAAPDIHVVAEAGDVDGALAHVAAHRPRVVVLDLRMPGRETIGAIPHVHGASPGTAVLVLTMEDDAAKARHAISSGARGYVLKDAADDELVAAVRAVARGETYLNPRLGARLAAAPAAEQDLPAGATFAGHRIDGLLARGGMAVVYRATDLALDRTVALKLVAPALSADPAFRARFEGECRIAASIDHPHVVAVHHAGEAGGRLYLTMRYVEGTDLRSVLERERRLPPARAVAIGVQIARGLEAAHRHGLVHRDVKPGNILVDRDEHAYLTDFGISRDLKREQQLTRAGFAVGTADFMAPEQAQGGAVDGRTDVYALGCVLFRSLTGALPFERPSEVDTLWAHVHDPAPHLRDVAPDLPGALGDIVARAMAKRPGDRQPSAEVLAQELLAVTSRPPDAEHVPARPANRGDSHADGPAPADRG